MLEWFRVNITVGQWDNTANTSTYALAADSVMSLSTNLCISQTQTNGCVNAKENSRRSSMTENFTAAPSPVPNQSQNISTRKKGTKSTHQHPVRKNAGPKVSTKQRTPEEEKTYQEGLAKAAIAQKARQELIGGWEKRVKGMSYRQIRGELKRVKRGVFLGEPVAPLDSAWALIADITMQTTKMRDNLAGQLCHYLNPSIAASSPRHTL